MIQFEKNTVDAVAVSQTNDSLPNVETRIVNVGQPGVDTAALVSQMETALTLIAETPKEQLDKVKTIHIEVPATIILGSAYVAGVTLK